MGRFTYAEKADMDDMYGLANVLTYLNATFGARWIGRGRPVRSPDLSSLDYFLWRHLKHLVYATPLDLEEDLVARIFESATRVSEIPGIFERVRQLRLRGYQACIVTGGSNF
ncbi:uncharacterized protein TNCV_4371621 [Trichonephila clavipes]|nr:uncharacterized protein TNCV_4371621 [Trichonephila clavipes]